jgi:uncharacterized membrane protein
MVYASMGKGRLEAFSDGVIAIIITIMVLEIKTPEHHELKDLIRVWPVFVNYLMSFIGLTCTCYFGYPCYPLSLHGWAKAIS